MKNNKKSTHALALPEYLLPSVLLLLLLVIVRNILMFGMSVDVSLVSGFLLFAFYMRMRCFIYKGALVLLPLNSPRLKWCLDMRGRLYPHLAPGLTKNVPDRVATHTIRKQWLQSACDAIERAGMFGRPIVSALESASFFPKISSSHLKSITSSLDFHYDHSRTC